MFGAIIGDMVGSVYEFRNHRSKDFPFFSDRCFPTDDSIMTIAVAKAILENDAAIDGLDRQAQKWMRKIGRQYPDCGFGGRFYDWMFSDHPHPYHSFGNGSAMRVSACGWAAKSLGEAKALSRAVTAVTHDHPEGIKGAEATACAIWLANNGSSKEEIRSFITEQYYSLDFTLDEIRPFYRFNETCQQTVPQAIAAFCESTSFEDAIRCAISVGGDSDTLAAITGSIAEAYYGIPAALRKEAVRRFRSACMTHYSDAYRQSDPDLLSVVDAFESKYGKPDGSRSNDHFETERAMPTEETCNIFVYGTLMRGERAHSYLAEAAFAGEYRLKDYALYNLGWYPGIVPHAGSCVFGEVYRINAAMLEKMDAYEGEGHLYHLKTVTVENDAGKLDAFAYLYAQAITGEEIRSGNWKTRIRS